MLIQVEANITYLIEIEVEEEVSNAQAISIAQFKFNPTDTTILDEEWKVIPPRKIKLLNYEKAK